MLGLLVVGIVLVFLSICVGIGASVFFDMAFIPCMRRAAVPQRAHRQTNGVGCMQVVSDDDEGDEVEEEQGKGRRGGRSGQYVRAMRSSEDEDVL